MIVVGLRVIEAVAQLMILVCQGCFLLWRVVPVVWLLTWENSGYG